MGHALASAYYEPSPPRHISEPSITSRGPQPYEEPATAVQQHASHVGGGKMTPGCQFCPVSCLSAPSSAAARAHRAPSQAARSLWAAEHVSRPLALTPCHPLLAYCCGGRKLGGGRAPGGGKPPGGGPPGKPPGMPPGNPGGGIPGRNCARPTALSVRDTTCAHKCQEIP